jgi:FKBP-type peptidyl-prolyl cis-trans isomerase SlpA
MQTVHAQSFLTLHYRIALLDGTEVVSTFSEKPATIALGQGQLISTLELVLIGLNVGDRQSFTLEPEKAFGMKNPDLFQWISLNTLKENSAANEHYVIGDLVEFNAPGGGQYAGILKQLNETAALFDFNHPLAGQTIIFEAQIIGAL